MKSTWLDKNKNIILAGIMVVTLALGGVFYWQRPTAEPIQIVETGLLPIVSEATSEPTPESTVFPSPTPAPVRVYISGSVINADVYFLPQGSIVKDAVMAAGGFLDEADLAQINLALELKDQQHIHVPAIGEVDPPPPVQNAPDTESVTTDGSRSTSINVTGPININTASLEMLDTLPGIGPAIAQRIIEYRQSMGQFQAVEEITLVSGIGTATLEKIRNTITVE